MVKQSQSIRQKTADELFDHFVRLALKRLIHSQINLVKVVESWRYKIYIYIEIISQWHVQRLPDIGIPVWTPKLCAQIK